MEKRIGQQLREAREARKLTLEAISYDTKIPIDRLVDLENDHLTAFGGMVYTRSFAKHYADYLGLDLQSEIDALPVPPLAGSDDYRYLTQNYGPWVSQNSTRSTSRKAPVAGIESRSFRFVTWLTGALLLMLVGGALAYFYLRNTALLAPTTSSQPKKIRPSTSATPPRQSWRDRSQSDLPSSVQEPPSYPDSGVIPKALPVEE